LNYSPKLNFIDHFYPAGENARSGAANRAEHSGVGLALSQPKRNWHRPIVGPLALLFTTLAFGPTLRAQYSLQSTTIGSQAPTGAPSSASAQSLYFGSVPNGKATTSVMQLSLKEAIQRGLRYNLAILIGDQQTMAARGAKWKALSALLPNLKAETSESVQQIDLQAFGFPGLPGVRPIVGPFSVFDARAYLKQPVLDFEALAKEKSASSSLKAAEYSFQNARDLAVLAVASAYLQAVADKARVKTAQVEVKTAESLYEKARDMHQAGLVPSIDALRSQVELKTRQQQLLAAKNGFDTAKLVLARTIGMPMDQAFMLTTKTPYAPLPPLPLDQALKTALSHRADYQSALARTREAEEARKAAARERWPSLDFTSNYGDIGIAPGNSHGTFTVAGNLTIPIFQGGKVRGDMMLADAEFRQRQAEASDLRARIEEQVRTALLDLNTASSQVQVAESSQQLAQQTLDQAEDRFAAGVVDNLEVVQAQETAADANESFIESLYQYNLAKATLAHALGVAETSALEYLGGD
jgi:outer membrane protein TolC